MLGEKLNSTGFVECESSSVDDKINNQSLNKVLFLSFLLFCSPWSSFLKSANVIRNSYHFPFNSC